MSANTLLEELNVLDIQVELLGNGNLYVAPRSKLTDTLIERIRAAKPHLVQMLAAKDLQPPVVAYDPTSEALAILLRLKAFTLPTGRMPAARAIVEGLRVLLAKTNFDPVEALAALQAVENELAALGGAYDPMLADAIVPIVHAFPGAELVELKPGQIKAHRNHSRGEVRTYVGLNPSSRRVNAQQSLFGLAESLPILKWAGGKRWLVPRMRKLFEQHQHRRLVEPFCGGLAITLALTPRRALANDINPHLINFYRHLQSGLRISLPMENRRELYDEHRKRFNRIISNGEAESAEAAALVYYLNRTCFNGLPRYNSKGEFNVPFGKYNNIVYQRDFTAHLPVFAGWELRCGDFEKLTLEAGDFVFADPPYDVQFTQYSKEPFSWPDQVRAAKWLAQHPGPVIATNRATSRIVGLYTELGFAIESVSEPQRINNTGDRTPAEAMLARRNC